MLITWLCSHNTRPCASLTHRWNILRVTVSLRSIVDSRNISEFSNYKSSILGSKLDLVGKSSSIGNSSFTVIWWNQQWRPSFSRRDLYWLNKGWFTTGGPWPGGTLSGSWSVWVDGDHLVATSLTHGRGGEGGHLWSRGNHLLQLVDTRACQHALLGYAGLTSSLTSHTQLDVTS